jgi:hypothetical protein
MNDAERRLFAELGEMDGVPWEDIGRINQEGYVDTDPIDDNPRIFEDQFEMRSREKERTPPNLQPITVVPNRSGPWSGNNQLGIEQPFAPDTNNLQTILKLDEWGFPELWTVVLGLDYGLSDDLADNNNFEVTAILQFGVGGVVQEVEVDWKNGATISLPMNAINVIARYNAPRIGRSSSSIPENLRLRVSLAKGALPGTSPTRSYCFQDNEDLEFVLPKFAKRLFLVPPDNDNSLAPFDFYTQDWNVVFTSAGALTSFSSATYQISQCVSFIDFTNQLVGGPMWLPVPPFARFVRVETSAGVQVNEEATLIFELAF